MTATRRRGSLLATLIAALICSHRGWAQPGDSDAQTVSPSSVAVIRPATGDRVLEEASSRVRSELDASGTSNRLVDCPVPGASEGPDCANRSSAARISIFREEGVATIQVMASLPDGLELRRHVRVPPEMGGDDPSVLAVRAVELLRDIYLDIPRVAQLPQARPSGARGRPANDVADRPPPATVSGRAMLGAGLLQGRWGLGAAFAPTFGFGVSFAARLSLLATLAGPFHTGVGGGAAAKVDTWQTLAVLQVRYELGPPRFRPFALAGGGLYSMRVQAPPPVDSPTFPGLIPSTLAPVLAVGVGVMVRILPWLAATADAQELVTWPTLDVTVGGKVVGRAGGPSDLVEAGLVLCRP